MRVLAWIQEGAGEGIFAQRQPGLYQASVFRFLRLAPYLKDAGLEVRTIPWPQGLTLAEHAKDLDECLEWAEVVLTWACMFEWLCRDCDFLSFTVSPARAHATVHRVFPSDLGLRALWPRLLASKVPFVYDFEDLPSQDAGNWWAPGDFPVDYRPLEQANLLTVSTDALAKIGRKHNRNVKVIRNTVDVSQYVPDGPRPEGPLRLVTYASPTHLYDYLGDAKGVRPSGCRAAVEAHHRDLRTCFVGAVGNALPRWRKALDVLPGSLDPARLASFDEVRPWVDWPDWPVALASAWPKIGVAPLGVTKFAACKSELHWLDYTACGAVTVAERFAPYLVIRDGVDGLLASGFAEWDRAIGRLIGSRCLREDLAGAAYERVLREYAPSRRVAEMAEIYRTLLA